jgi:phosphoglucomutase
MTTWSTSQTVKTWLNQLENHSDLKQELQGLIDHNDESALNDCFYKNLSFGTGGLRGKIGVGTNRMNIYTVRKASQGLANWLKSQDLPQMIAIAYDSRIKSDVFAREAALVFAANGIEAWIYPTLMPTPSLSFAVRALECGAGICITASHNPAEYNGYKVYGPDGCQITTEMAGAILEHIEALDIFDDIKQVSDKATQGIHTIPQSVTDAYLDHVYSDQATQRIHTIPQSITDAYLDHVYQERLEKTAPYPDLNIVYSPLNGAGKTCVLSILDRAGYKNIHMVDEQTDPDGHFPTCPYPNPEMKEAMTLSLALAKDKAADLVLATDPDSDRVGVGVCDRQGAYQLLTGNQVGVLLLNYICRRRKDLKTMPEAPIAVKTIVTSRMAEAIAAAHDVRVINVLTGFKFIGEKIGILEKTNQADRYIFGFEESCGYLSGSYVRDKDAVNAVLLITDMAAYYKAQGNNLLEVLENLYETYGYYLASLDSYTFEGQEGAKHMADLMQNFRDKRPEKIASVAVKESKDYLMDQLGSDSNSYEDTTEKALEFIQKADVLRWTLEDDSTITLRPSGTEPKLKVYISVRGKNKADAQSKLQAFRSYFSKLNDF